MTIKRISQFFVTTLCLLLPPLASAMVENYGYPITDRFAATVVGTPAQLQADLPSSIPFRTRRIDIFPDRSPPDVLWYDEELLYSVALQKRQAPLVFLIAGTGASHNGGKNKYMARAFFQAGFHVVSISSPTFINFVVAASNTGVPGHAEHDAEDLYRVMEMVWAELKGSVQASSFNLVGYSLGAFNAAFVSKLDEDRQSFNFSRVLLINPPVSIYNSISLLDRMSENIPGGVGNFDRFFNQLVQAFSQAYKRSDDAVGEDFLYKAYESLGLKDEQLAALIGVSFRLSSGSMVFVSDVISDAGFAKPKGMVLDRYADLSPYRQVIYRTGFTDYYHELFYPFYKHENPDISRDEFITAISLRSIADYLRSAEKITVMHNADDIILEPGEIDFFAEVFGDRATIFPHGGHLGNMEYRDNTAHMLSTFTGGAK